MTRAVAYLRVLSVLVIAGSLSCAGRSVAPVVTGTPMATPTAAVDPVIEDVATHIERTMFLATVLQSTITASKFPPALGTQGLAIQSQQAIDACQELRRATSGREIRGYSAGAQPDLWPQPFLKLDHSTAEICYPVLVLVDGGSMTLSFWTAIATVSGAELDSAIKSLPDLSKAQLRRTIAERR